MKKIISLFFLLYASWQISYSQNHEQAYIDSLLTQIGQAKTDTQKIKLYSSILSMHVGFKPEEGLKYEKPALEIAERINKKPAIAFIKITAGRLYWRMGNFDEALKRHNEGLSIYTELKDSIRMATVLTYIGQDYADGGHFPQALDYFSRAMKISASTGDLTSQAYLHSLVSWVNVNLGNYPEAASSNIAALKLYERVGDKYGIAVTTSNIAGYYKNLENYPEAMKYYTASADALKKNNDLANLSSVYLDMGDVYQKTGDADEAMKYLNLALEMSRQRNDSLQIANAQQSIGRWYERRGNYTEALNYYLSASDGFRAISNKQQLATILSDAGICYTRLSRYKEAGTCLSEAKRLSDELGSQAVSSFYYERQEKFDSTLGDWKNAYFHYKLHIRERDSINSVANNKKILQLNMQYAFDKKEAATKAEQEKKDAVATADLERQKLLRNVFVSGFIVMLLFAGVFFTQRNRIKKEKQRSDELLLNILPGETAEELKHAGTAKARSYDEVTVMFTDFKNFTHVAEKLSAEELVHEINYCYSEFDKIISKHNIEKIKTIGDSYMCAGGLPVANRTNAFDVVGAAIEIREFMYSYAHSSPLAKAGSVFGIRIGIHSGPVVGGIVGIKKFAYDIWGDTVNIASRMESSGEAGKVNISGATYALVKEKFHCIHRGKIEAKNKGEIDMYFVEHLL